MIRPGSRTRNVILTELRDYLWVDELPPIDLRTGRIEGPVRSQVVQDGAPTGTFRASIATDVATLLRAVHELAADQERSEEVDAPTTVFVGFNLEG